MFYIFLNCTELSSITIPNSVTFLSGFTGCTGLSTFTIPNNVTTIGSSAFSGCTGLTSIIIPPTVTTILDYAFSGAGLTSITIPGSITSIGDSAFSGCTNLISVNMLNGITSIKGSAFWGCSGLTNITFPNSLSYIGEYAFTNCSNVDYVQIFSVESWLNLWLDQLFNNAQFYLDKVNIKLLTTLNIPEGVTYIRKEAFKGFNKLTSILIPSSITSISNEAFYGCDNLTDIYCLSESAPSVGFDVFKDSYIEYATLHVPAVSIDDYKNYEPWSRFGKIVALNGEDIPETPETPKCATPTISFKDGKISFSCETEGVEFISEIESPSMTKNYDQEITLSSTYTVTVYATKSGYDNSEKASIEIQANSGIMGDLTGDGKVDVADHVKLSDIIMNQK